MKRSIRVWLATVFALCLGSLAPQPLLAAGETGPIILGVPTSLGFTSGKECLNSVVLATEEINSKGGVNVGGTKRKFQVESIDIRDAAPGVPVPVRGADDPLRRGARAGGGRRLRAVRKGAPPGGSQLR